MSERVFRFLTSLIALLAVSTTALAQGAPSINYTSYEAVTTAPVQLSYYGSIHKDCSPAPPVTIRVSESPKLGMFTIRPGQITISPSGICPGLKVPVQVVFYQARRGAAGSDHLVYEVIDASDKLDVYDVTVSIRPGPTPAAPGSDKPI